MEIACYSLWLEFIAKRTTNKMSRFKIYASLTLIFRKQASLDVNNGHISLYAGFLKKNE